MKHNHKLLIVAIILLLIVSLYYWQAVYIPSLEQASFINP